MTKIRPADAFKLEIKCGILKRFSKNCARFNRSVKSANGMVYVTLQNVTYSGEVFQKDIYLENLLKMDEKALKRYAESYLS